MLAINITSTVTNMEELADMLRYIASEIDTGYTSGYEPSFTVIGEEECDECDVEYDEEEPPIDYDDETPIEEDD